MQILFKHPRPEHPFWRKEHSRQHLFALAVRLENHKNVVFGCASATFAHPKCHFRRVQVPFSSTESTYKKCLGEEWGKFTGCQLLSSFWLKVARTDEDGNTPRWDRETLPIRNLYPKWGMLRFGRIKKVTNWIWILWFIVSYWWVT